MHGQLLRKNYSRNFSSIRSGPITSTSVIVRLFNGRVKVKTQGKFAFHVWLAANHLSVSNFINNVV